jgi:uncharacterized membrane protein YkoI
LKKHISVIVLGLSMLSLAVQGQAQLLPLQVEQNQLDRSNPLREIRNNPQVNGRITDRQAVNLARQQFAGNILRVTLIGEPPNQRYQIRMENAGKVFTVFVHATTGEVTGDS